MQLTGSLDLVGAVFVPADGRALNLNKAAIGGSLYLLNSPTTQQRCRVGGRIELGHATVLGEVFIRNADLTAPPIGGGGHFYNAAPNARRIFLLAPRLKVHGALRIEGDTVVRGGVLLPGANLGAGVSMEGALWNPHDTALDFANATLGGGVAAAGASIEGTVSLDTPRWTVRSTWSGPS